MNIQEDYQKFCEDRYANQVSWLCNKLYSIFEQQKTTGSHVICELQTRLKKNISQIQEVKNILNDKKMSDQEKIQAIKLGISND